MLTRGRLLFVTLSLATVLLVAAGRMLAEQSRQTDDGRDSLYKYLAVFTEVFSLVDRAYVDELDEATLMAGALEGTLDALDPFALYVPADRVASFEASRAVGRRRSGLLVLKERGVAFAAAVEEGSPAAAAGLERGHILARIQGRRTRQMPLYEIHEILAGAVGTEIEIERLDEGQKEVVRFALGEYPRPETELSVRRGAPILRLRSFDDGVLDAVRASLEAIRNGSAALPELTERDRLVLDLRGSAGGSPEAAFRVAGLFASGELGALLERGDEVETFAGGLAPLWQGKLVVLVDRGTLGPAEALAAVLQQAADASLVGDRSFGHCGRLGLYELEGGARLQITEAFYAGPDREPLNRSLQPDLWVRPDFVSDDDPDRDEILERGLDRLFEEDEEAEERQAA